MMSLMGRLLRCARNSLAQGLFLDAAGALAAFQFSHHIGGDRP